MYTLLFIQTFSKSNAIDVQDSSASVDGFVASEVRYSELFSAFLQRLASTPAANVNSPTKTSATTATTSKKASATENLRKLMETTDFEEDRDRQDVVRIFINFPLSLNNISSKN